MPPAPPPAPGGPAWLRRPEGIALLAVAASTALHVVYAGLLPLSPQEAYYWSWGQRLDWSYFDHPPLASWTVRGLGELLGTSERAVRAAAALHSSIFSLFFFLCARRLAGPGGALAAVVVALLTPLFSMGQVIVTPDGPLLAMWAAAMYFALRAVEEDGRWLLLAGLATGLAALGKYTGWLLAPQILLLLLLDPRGRRLLRTPWPWAGVALAAAAFAPVILWNARHGWASFGFQFGERASALAGPRLVRTLRFLGLQALLATPLLALILWGAALGALRRLRDPAFRFTAVFSVPALLLFAAVSPFAWVKGNWPAIAWPAATIAAVAFWREGRIPRWAAWPALGLAALGTAYVHLAPLVPALPFSGRDEPTRGWPELAARVQAELERIGPGAFVIGCSYKPAAELHYYLPGRPWTWSAETMGEEGLQYRFWSDPRELVGREGIVVEDLRDGGTCQSRGQRCDPLVELPPLVVDRPGMWRAGGLVPAGVTTFRLWRCRYLVPPDPR